MSESKKGGREIPKLKKTKKGDVDFGLFAHRFMSHASRPENDYADILTGVNSIENQESNAQRKLFRQKSIIAYDDLCVALGDQEARLIRRTTDPKVAWDILNEEFQSTNWQNSVDIEDNIRRLRYHGTNFNEVVGLFKGYSDDLEAIGFRRL